MARPRLRPSLPSCTCTWRSSRPIAPPSHSAYSTLSTPPPPQAEPILDFLYPTFGFFSRSLPSPRSTPLTTPSPPPIPPSHAQHIAGTSSPARPPPMTWRRGFGAAVKCVCGRPKQSCLRCRAVSTSAAPRPVLEELEINEEGEEAPPQVEDPLQDEQSAPSPAPPPPLRLEEPAEPSGGQEAARYAVGMSSSSLDRPPPPPLSGMERREFIRAVKADLSKKSARFIREVCARVAPFGDLAGPLPTVDVLEAGIEEHWSQGQQLIALGGEGLSPRERGEFVKRFSQLARVPRRLVNDPLQERLQVQRWAQMRRQAGWYMRKMLQAMTVAEAGSHGRHEPVLWLDAQALREDIGPVPFHPPSACPSIDQHPFLHRLYMVFCHPTSSGDELRRVETLRTATLDLLLEDWLRERDGAEQALHLVCGWQLYGLLDDAAPERRTAGYQLVLRRRYGEILGRLTPSPSAWFQTAHADAPEARVVGPHLVTCLATTGNPLEALRVWQVLRAQGRSSRMSPEVELKTMAVLLEGLTQRKLYEDGNVIAADLSKLAQTLASSKPTSDSIAPPASLPSTSADLSPIRPHLVHAFHVLARHAAAQGKAAALEEAVAHMEALGGVDNVEKASRRIRAAGEKGDLRKVRAVFDQVVQQEQSMSAEARARLTATVVAALVRMDDIESATKVLEELLEDGVWPTVHLVNSLLHAHAARNDVDTVYQVFLQLATGEFGPVNPNVDSYNALVVAHCNLRDVDSAEEIVQRMKVLGLSPNQRVWTTLMNAYVELGNWKRAVEVYALLEKSKDTLLRSDTASLNVVLKAAILTATPASTVLRIFRQALERGQRPSSTTYTLVMHSVCTAGLMTVAEELFAMLDTPPDRSALPIATKKVRPDVFVFSTLISGYIKAGQMVKARACLAEMRRRGIEPTSVTFGIIVGSFLHDQTKAGAKRASDFALRFLSDSPLDAVRHRQLVRLDKHLARGDELLNVFAPILKYHAKQGQADLALVTFQLVLDGGARPSVELYTTLMDAYQHGGDLLEAAKNVGTVWRGLHQSVLDAYGREAKATHSIVRAGSTTPPSPRRSSSTLHLDDIISPRSLVFKGASTSTAPSIRISPSHAHTLRLPLNILIESLDRAGCREAIHETWSNLADEGFTFDAANWNALARHLARDQQLERACWIIQHILTDSDVVAGNQVAVKAIRSGERQKFAVESPFGTVGTPSMAAPTRTPSRLADWRQVERDAHRKDPVSVRELVDAPVVLPELSEVDAIGQAQASRRKRYWFAHATMLKELERGLEALAEGQGRRAPTRAEMTKPVEERAAIGKEQAGEVLARLHEAYPRAFEALAQWRKPMELMMKGGMQGRRKL